MSHKTIKNVPFQITTTNKRVNVVNIETQMMMRTTREFAVHGVNAGLLRYTTKSALKKFMKRDVQMKKNERFLGKVEANKIKRYLGYTVKRYQDPKGRQYAVIGGVGMKKWTGGGQVLVTQY